MARVITIFLSIVTALISFPAIAGDPVKKITKETAKQITASVPTMVLIGMVVAVVVSIIVVDILKKYKLLPSDSTKIKDEISSLRGDLGKVLALQQEVRPEGMPFDKTPIGRALHQIEECHGNLAAIHIRLSEMYDMASLVMPLGKQPFDSSEIGRAFQNLASLRDSTVKLQESLSGFPDMALKVTGVPIMQQDLTEIRVVLEVQRNLVQDIAANQKKVALILGRLAKDYGD